MRTLQLPYSAKARIWIGDLPRAGYPARDTLRRTYAALGSANGTKAVGAVEVIRAVGRPSSYGLLGGELVLDASSDFRVTVHTAMPHGSSYADTIAAGPEHVRVGLLEEYAEGVFEGVELAKNHVSFDFAGELTVNRAAHSDVESSQIMFKHLSLVLMKMLCMQEQSPSGDDLLDLFWDKFGEFD
ncbi:MAG TPA: hypothetical protein VF651_05955 [Gammaproteobacteria bacterium]